MDLTTPISDARNTINRRSCVLVRVTTKEGFTGWGECASFAGCGSLVVDCLKFLSPKYVGRETLKPAKLYDEVYFQTQHFGRRGVIINALSGIDIALWDVLAKKANLPLTYLLGAQRDSIRGYFNSGYYTQDHREFLVESIRGSIERGCDAIKIKIGRHGFTDDVWRIETARDLIGPSGTLMVDANSCLSLHEVRRLDDCMMETGCRWIEEPVPLQNLDTLSSLRRSIRTPIAGYELEMTLAGHTALIRAGAVDVVQPDTIWSGGITECIRIAAVCASANLEFIPHNFAGTVSLAANAHVAAAAPTGGWLEVDSNINPFLWDMDTNRHWTFDGKHIEIPDVPGIGVEPDLEFIKEYSVKL